VRVVVSLTLETLDAFNDLAKAIAEGDPRLRVVGASGAARALLLADLHARDPRPMLVLVAGVADAHRLTQDLRFFGASAHEFPEPEPRLWRGARQREGDAERAAGQPDGALEQRAPGDPGVVEALHQGGRGEHLLGRILGPVVPVLHDLLLRQQPLGPQHGADPDAGQRQAEQAGPADAEHLAAADSVTRRAGFAGDG